ncbi:hypothetical protein B0A48_05668 [Cryoendolithus antarcticus]|uniref:Glycosyltransferase family 31 protein n=1 Tax=Cryoendolithus antarcticus TaxID=1507870 RepID=A0A1V8TC04_9PEZI|nr:hypothetical protein B0A48_05668 [Cryoendolithus antarcticus]
MVLIRLHHPSAWLFTQQRKGDGEEHLDSLITQTRSPKDPCTKLKQLGIHKIAFNHQTGATEIHDKIPVRLLSLYACLRPGIDDAIYSDLAQRIGPAEVQDAVGSVSCLAHDANPEYRHYDALKEHVQHGGDASEMAGDAAWHLDKWKFLPMISESYHFFAKHDMQWVFFKEADTYVSPYNPVQWISRLDPHQPLYAGAQVVIGETEFAHGGSGILMPGRAVLAPRKEYLANQNHWEDVIAADCSNSPVPLHRSFPLIQGETLSSLDWSETHWCRPAITWHHVDAAGIEKLWNFEHRFFRVADTNAIQPGIIFAKYFDAFIFPRLKAANYRLQGWDSLSGDWVFTSVENPREGQAEYDVAAKTPESCESFAARCQLAYSGLGELRLAEGIESSDLGGSLRDGRIWGVRMIGLIGLVRKGWKALWLAG